jgi:Fe-S cluster assembly iron-binding protein IscA
MALDEPKEKDTIYTEQNITFAIDRDLLETIKPVRIDFVDLGGQSGFLLTPKDELPSLTGLQDFHGSSR